MTTVSACQSANSPEASPPQGADQRRENPEPAPASRASADGPKFVVADSGEKVKEAVSKEKGKSIIATDVGMQRLAGMAKTDLAARTGVPADEIETLEARYVTWPDYGAGCPEPGRAYPQALTNGALMRFRAGGQEYRYHSSEQRKPFLCKNPVGEPVESAFGEK